MRKGKNMVPSMKFLHRDVEAERRILVVSDIHGHSTLLRRLLADAKFCDRDLLVIVGDLIEKGPDSLGTLRYIMELCERGNTIALLGNVDAWRLLILDNITPETAGDAFRTLCPNGWISSIFAEMLLELGLTCESPQALPEIRYILLAHFQRELDFLASLPTVLETQKYVFVHGGLRRQDIAENEHCDYMSLLKYDNFYSVAPAFSKYVVVGHFPVMLYNPSIPSCNPVLDHQRRIISIDGGCGIKEYGQLNLLIIPHIDAEPEAISFLARDALPTEIALDAQQASPDSLNLRWTDNHVTVLDESDAEFRKVRHLSSGRVLWIPRDYLFNDSQAFDFTDYCLPVSPGDRISILRKTSRGYLAKKDGVFGWYCGKTAKVN